MSDENLTEVLEDKADYLAYKKAKTIEKLSERTHLTLAQLAKLVGHEEHGAIVGEITLAELIDPHVEAAVASIEAKLEATVAKIEALREGAEATEATEEVEETAAKATKKAPTAKKKVAKKTSKGAPAAKKSVKKRAAAAAPPADGRKADFGKKKPRLQREQGYKEILAALKAAGEPCSRGALEEATGYTGVQTRTFCKELAEQGKIAILGSGGRSTKYAIA